MRWMYCAMVAVMTLSVNLQADERRNGVNLRDEVLEVRVYPVADLVVPLPPGDQSKPEFAALMRYLRASTGEDVWNGGGSIQSAEKTLSLAIRQRSSVHEKIADALNELRGELSAQVSLEFRVVSGPRRDIAALAEAFPGELGKYEAEQLQQRITASNKFNLLFAPKITTFSGMTAQVSTGGADSRVVQAHATVSTDRRSVSLKVVEGREKNLDVIAAVQSVKLHSGRTAVLRFDAPKSGGVIPPAADAEERLVLVTARVIVVEEVEEKQPTTALLMVTPRGPIILEEEEELLGLPTE